MDPSLKPLITEFWVEYALGTAVMLVRFYARWKVAGFRNPQLDDWFIFLAFLLWIPLIIGMHFTMVFGNNIGQTEESVWLIPPEMAESMVKGSKLGFSTWILYMSFIWSLKAAVLSLCYRIAKGLPMEMKIVKGVGVISALAYLGCVLGHVLQCLPVHKTWQIQPYPGDNCTLRNANYYIIAVLNTITDACIIATPFPVLIKASLSLKRKLLLVPLVCSGFFIMIATILRAYYSLDDITKLPIAAAWASREEFVAAVAVCIPGIKPLFSASKWVKSQNKSGDRYGSNKNNGTGGGGGGWSASFKKPTQNFEMSNGMTWDIKGNKHKGHRLSSSGSQEFIIDKGAQSTGEDSHAITITKETIVSRTH